MVSKMLKFMWIECLNNSYNHRRDSLVFISGFLLNKFQWCMTARERAVAQLVDARRYKSEGRRFDSRWCHWNF